MLRLRAPGHERFFQSNMMEATFGGGEANVAVSLANYGMDTQYCTVLPDNAIGDECIKELRVRCSAAPVGWASTSWRTAPISCPAR